MPAIRHPGNWMHSTPTLSRVITESSVPGSTRSGTGCSTGSNVWEAGDDKAFGDITATWLGAVDAATTMQATVQGSYDPGYIYRTNTFTFNKGSEVYLLDAPDGEVFVMQSFTRHLDPTLREDNLAHLGGRLDLPDGWGFRTETLDEDLEVSSASHDNLTHVLQDNLHNIYQGSDAGRAFSQLCRQDSQW